MNGSLKIENALFLITLDPKRRVIRDGALLIDGKKIVKVGKTADLRLDTAERVIDASEMVITPGFCNGHIHVGYAHAVRGIFPDDLQRRDYVESVFKLQAAMTEEEEYFTTLLALTELVRYGTTTLLDPGTTKSLPSGIEACRIVGCRMIVGTQVVDRETSLLLPIQTTKEAIRQTEDTILRYDKVLDGRVRAWAMPFSARLATVDLLRALKELADSFHTGITLHQNFDSEGIKLFVEEHGMRPVALLERLDVVGSNVLLSHATGLDQSEVDSIAATGTSVVLCPSAAMKLGVGLGPHSLIPEMLARGVCVALGTDSGNASNLVETMRAMYLAAVAFKDARQATSMVSAETALEMATLHGASALGLEAEIGSLEAGKLADLVMFDTRRPEWRAIWHPVNTLVYSADGRSVHTVIVDGRVLVENYRVLFVDEMHLFEKVQKIGERLLSQSESKWPPRWPVI